MINVNRTYLPDKEAYSVYLDKIWESRWLTNRGPLLQELEQKISSYLNCNNLQVTSNGTVAIQLALKALEIKGEVITTPYSYVATTGVLLWENCKPVFCDVKPDDFCINADLIEEKITNNTSAILATHVYGLPCDVGRIESIALKHNLKVIYDGAHAFGCRYNGRALLDYGDIATCSTHATKVFHTVEGGLIVTPDKALHDKMFLQKSFGHKEDDHICVGINGKNSEFHAAMGLCLIGFMDENISKRKKLYRAYRQLLAGVPLFYPVIPEGLNYNYAYFPVLFESEQVMLSAKSYLASNGVNTRRYFYPSLNKLPYLSEYAPCKVSEDVAVRALCLPFYYDLSMDEVSLISELICKFLLKYRCMKIAVMQPYLFPYIGYFQLINAVDKFVLFDDVNYINKGWINRNNILVNNAGYMFTVPLIGASQNKLINEIEIDSDEKWKVKFLRTIEMSYSKAPYFKEVIPIIKEIVYNSNANLSTYIYYSMSCLAGYLNISTQIISTSGIYPNQLLKGAERIMDICEREGATEYINPIGGMELYQKDKFEAKGIELFFIKTNGIEYSQNGKPFVPWLSIIDVIMFCSKQQVAELLGKYELV